MIKINVFWYHLFITIIFIYVFTQFLTLKRSNFIYRIFADYVMNRYCIILYLLLSILIMKYDCYTSILLIILVIAPFKTSLKEFFQNENVAIPTKIVEGQIVADFPVPTATFLEDTVNKEKLIESQSLGIDERFKMDDVVVKDILRQIKAQVDFDPYKTNLSKEVSYEIYNKYFDNDIFVKLKNNNDDSKTYLAAGNFNYVPTVAQVDYDLITYQNLNNNIEIGVNPIVDGIKNKAQVNRNL